MEIGSWLRQSALELGFARVGVCAAHPPGDGERLRQWIGAGHHGTMRWMERTLPERLDPERVLPGVRSVLVAALNYAPPAAAPPEEPLTGRVSIYARGRDYHRVLIHKLETLRRELEARQPGCRTRVCVDTSPLLERYWAQAAGVGWVGKNTNLIVERLGSYVFLGALLCDLDLGADSPAVDRCGSCQRCLGACPTSAFEGAWQLNSRRCISYLTVEHRGEIDPTLAGRMGSWVFGCDDCQTVCPWNRFAVPAGVPEFDERPVTRLPLAELSALSEAQFDSLTRGRGWRRARRSGLRRNAIIALGNSGDPRARAPLSEALSDPDPELRRQAAQALERLDERLGARQGSA